MCTLYCRIYEGPPVTDRGAFDSHANANTFLAIAVFLPPPRVNQSVKKSKKRGIVGYRTMQEEQHSPKMNDRQPPAKLARRSRTGCATCRARKGSLPPSPKKPGKRKLVNGSTTRSPMVKRMIQADSTHQLGLKPILHAFLIVD